MYCVYKYLFIHILATRLKTVYSAHCSIVNDHPVGYETAKVKKPFTRFHAAMPVIIHRVRLCQYLRKDEQIF